MENNGIDKLKSFERDSLGRFLKGGNKGEKHWAWNNGIRKHSSGYTLRVKSDHPFADSNGCVYEHRLVIEEYLSCNLLSWCSVHHKNGVKTDNRIENLEPMMSRDHTQHHHKVDKSDRVCIICKSTKTFYHKQRLTYCWYSDPVTKQRWVCTSCYQRRRN